MKKLISLIPVFLCTCLFTVLPASAATYGELYADAIADAQAAHAQLLNTGEISADNYSGIGYALCDITGDGFKELVVRQVTAKHWSFMWVYGYDGTSDVFMGEFGCDADWDGLYGYKNGLLYRESYKGMLTLYLASWDGSSFTVNKLCEDTYPRDAAPPPISNYADYYDASCLLEQVPEFVTFDDSATLQEEAPKLSDSVSGERLSVPEKDAWKAAYKSAINEIIQGSDRTADTITFMMMYIDGDDIPEVAMALPAWADPVYIITWHDGRCDWPTVGSLASYIEKTGLMLESDAHMGWGWDSVYLLEDGVITRVGHGEYTWLPSEGASEEEMLYKWDGESVSSEEYENKLDSMYRFTPSKSGFDERCSYEEIMSAIDQFETGTALQGDEPSPATNASAISSGTYEFPSSVGEGTAAEIAQLASALGLQQTENDLFPDGFYEGNGILMGSNLNATVETPCLYLCNDGNPALSFLGLTIGMTREEVLDTARSISPSAEIRENGRLYLGGENGGPLVLFDDDGRLTFIEYSMFYTG